MWSYKKDVLKLLRVGYTHACVLDDDTGDTIVSRHKSRSAAIKRRNQYCAIRELRYDECEGANQTGTGT